ncbi:hypothetical protein HG531_005915 [Fusarium graminearum]|nr:hypothetical protein HG531_005915 [Fusarium graminearum]
MLDTVHVDAIIYQTFGEHCKQILLLIHSSSGNLFFCSESRSDFRDQLLIRLGVGQELICNTAEQCCRSLASSYNKKRRVLDDLRPRHTPVIVVAKNVRHEVLAVVILGIKTSASHMFGELEMFLCSLSQVCWGNETNPVLKTEAARSLRIANSFDASEDFGNPGVVFSAFKASEWLAHSKMSDEIKGGKVVPSDHIYALSLP